MNQRLLRAQVVAERTGLARATIYKFVARGDFPRPVQLGDKTVAWVEAEIDAWIAQRIAARDAA